MAVDRSKFRTCSQTSFCRRHRQQPSHDGSNDSSDTNSRPVYTVMKDSWKFHTLPKQNDDNDVNENEMMMKSNDEKKHEKDDRSGSGGGSGGVWSSLQRRILGSGSSSSSMKDDQESSSYKKPNSHITPTLTGRLQSSSSSSSSIEYLDVTITALQNNMIRVQITEVDHFIKVQQQQDDDDEAHPPPRRRVTYDDLVLQQDIIIQHAHWVEWIKQPISSSSSSSSKKDNNDHHQTLQRILQHRNVPESDYSKYTALLYGDSINNNDTNNDSNDSITGTGGGMCLLVQMEPYFMVSLYRIHDISAGAIIELNTDQLLHTEIRKLRKGKNHDNEDNNNNKSEKEETNDDDEEKQNPNHNPDKEIVGYWEDGLAIYADGTREEKKQVIDLDNEGTDIDSASTAEHRKLSVDESNNNWEEHFGTHVDSKPYGPMSVGIDIVFPNSNHIYGIPEHASRTTLQTTIRTRNHDDNNDVQQEESYYKEPYRLYNLDVFEYELDETMALYGAVPFMISQSIYTGTSGIFYFNPTETFIDIQKMKSTKSTITTTKTHWMSESGILDLFLLPGPNPHTLYEQYSILTGVTPLPPMFSLGYHQCRWNYKDETDVAQVHAKFEELDYPYDVLWLDIEHTNGKRYFTWDKNLFPTPKVMQQNLAQHGRYMVTIIDPHIFRDDNYYIHKEATAKGLYIKDKDGNNDFDGWCWPGSSSYLDFTAEHVRSWWADQFQYNKYIGSTSTLFTWNDMNEPSVFNGPEVSMQKDLRNLNGDEHREWHNLYGMLFHRATGEGQIRRNPPLMDQRPFVLSRSFFAGSQRYGSIWTGDNAAEWSHLEIAAPMLLSLNTAALSFVGADVGGFFGNPDAELFTRWMQAGAYQPFFRGHAHHDSKRREPWMFDGETLVRLRHAAMKRYALLPYWYTIFYEAEMTGMPVMRMMWMEYPKTEAMFGIDDQYLIGTDLLVKPITTEQTVETEVMFPTDHVWYDVETMQSVSTSSTPVKNNDVVTKTVPADIDTIPVYQRGGSILPRKLRLRRSSTMMKTDPYTLYIALDDTNQASGKLHMDDEISFGYKKRSEYADAFFSANFDIKNGKISNTVTLGAGWATNSTTMMTQLSQERMIERIVVMGVKTAPSNLITMNNDSPRSLDFSYGASTKILVIRKPELSAVTDWIIKMS